MPMSDSPNSLLRAVRGLDGTRRFLGLAALAGVVVIVWLLSGWASAPTYVTLYRELDLKEAAAIVESLGKAGIKHRLGAGGTDVLVPMADAARARVSLAKDGLPADGRPGLELFDKPTWGMTDFTQRVTYQRALEGELARTIGGLRGVERAQVHLVLATSGPLHRLERPAAASVVLSLKPGATLAPEAVQGITYIVSNSVEQLSSDNVAVMDDAGHVLSVPSESASAAGLSTRQLEIQRSVEQHLSDKIEDLLATVVGTGRAQAQVSALLSFDQVDRTIEAFDPDGQVLQTEQRSEPVEGAAAEGSGAASVVNNAYLNSRRLEKIIGSVGNVTRLTVAVLVDEKAVGAGGAAGARNLGVPELEAMVRNAIGADSTRGDRVSVMAVPFGVAAVPGGAGGKPEKTGPDVIMVAERVSRPVVGIAAIVVLLLLALRLLRPVAAPAPAAAPAAAGAGEVPGTKELAGRNGPELLQLRNRLQAESAERPEAAARVVRSWLAESSR